MSRRLDHPLPHLSAEANRALAKAAEQTSYPAPTATAEWLDLVSRFDARTVEELRRALGDSPADRTTVTGVPVAKAAPSNEDPAVQGAVLLHFHGGGLVFLGGDVVPYHAVVEARTYGLHTWSVDYRMPPLHPFPAGLDDGVAVYRALLQSCPFDRIVVGGTSAGGNLAASTLLRARDEGLPMPAALVLLTPEVDLTESGDSFRTLAAADNTLSSLAAVNALYAGEHALTHPYVSPLFADLRGLPPVFLQAGTRDLFLSNTVRMHRALLRADVPAELHVFEAMPHAGFGQGPEEEERADAVRRFVARHLRPRR